MLAGLSVALLAVAVVLQPIVERRAVAVRRRDIDDDDELEFTTIEESDSPKVKALIALREIEFDRATGKLSDGDYRALKAKYARVALEAIEAEEEGAAEGDGEGEVLDPMDAAERAVARAKERGARVCPACGPRPETTAVFCSQCGRNLTLAGARARCASCGSPLSDGAKFCPECGLGVT